MFPRAEQHAPQVHSSTNDNNDTGGSRRHRTSETDDDDNEEAGTEDEDLPSPGPRPNMSHRGRLRLDATGLRKLRAGEVMSLYTPEDLLGRGNFGQVWTVRERGTRTLHVWKQIDKRRAHARNSTSLGEFLNEARALQRLSAEGQLSALYVPALIDAFQDPSAYYLVMENCTSFVNLGDFIRQGRVSSLTDEELVVVVDRLVSGMQAIHALRVAHVDIKPDNILFDPETLDVRIVDFGFAVFDDDDDDDDDAEHDEDGAHNPRRLPLSSHGHRGRRSLGNCGGSSISSAFYVSHQDDDATSSDDVPPVSLSLPARSQASLSSSSSGVHGYQDIGTRRYQAPELRRRDPTLLYDLTTYQRCDLWSLGVTLAEFIGDRVVPDGCTQLLDALLQVRPHKRHAVVPLPPSANDQS